MAARKVHKRLAKRNLFLYLIFVKMGPNLIGKFYWISYIVIHIIDFVSILI